LIPLYVTLLLSLPLDVFAQPVTGTVTGHIVEARTAAPLAAVLVKIQATGQQAFSDAEGRFEIADVPAGPQTLLVSVVGYGLVRRSVTVVTGEAVDVSIPVAEGASTYVEDVAVSASPFRESEPGVASQTVLGSRDLLALRGLVADDPFRAVQVLPGVATGDDFRAEFAVRGLGPQNIGIAIDGIDSPLLFHTVRGVQDTGSLALINSDILESATLMAGVHPQRLGSHLGSRLDFTTRDGSRDRLTVRGLLSASAASTVWEGPLAGKTGSWLVAVRRSYIDWLLRQIDSTTDTTFGFTDGQGKVTFDLTPKQTLRVSLLAGRSVLREMEDPPSSNTLDPATSTTFVGNVQWRYTPSAQFSLSQQVYALKSDYRNQVFDGRVREEGGDVDLTWRGAAEWNPRAGHFIEFGAQAQSLEVDRLDKRFSGVSSETIVLDKQTGASSQAAWAQYRWTPSTRVAITPGVRVEHWGLIDRTEASPWLLSEWEFRPGTKVKLAAGLQRQAPSIDHTFYTQPGTGLGPETSRTIEGGLEHRFGSAWRAAGTVYHRKDEDGFRLRNGEFRLENDRVVFPANPNMVNALSGDTRGVELLLERRSANGLTGWLSYAWSNSELTDRRGGSSDPPESFPSDFDQRHTVNAYVAYRWSGRTSLSARMRYGSNFPIPGYVEKDAAGYVMSDQRNGARLPEYARLDLRADRTFTYRKSRLTLFMEVVNATARDNFRGQSAGINLQTRRVFEPTEKLFPLLPVAGLLIEF
jgi:hypothetical protein